MIHDIILIQQIIHTKIGCIDIDVGIAKENMKLFTNLVKFCLLLVISLVLILMLTYQIVYMEQN